MDFISSFYLLRTRDAVNCLRVLTKRLQKVTSIKPSTADPWKAIRGQLKKEQTESNKDGKDG